VGDPWLYITLTLCHILHSVSHWPVLVYYFKCPDKVQMTLYSASNNQRTASPPTHKHRQVHKSTSEREVRQYTDKHNLQPSGGCIIETVRTASLQFPLIRLRLQIVAPNCTKDCHAFSMHTVYAALHLWHSRALVLHHPIRQPGVIHVMTSS
jgi:hypothetical protein